MGRGLRVFLSLAVTLLLLGLFVRGVDAAQVWKETRSARPAWLLLCLAGSILHYGLRAARWKTLLSPAAARVPYRLALSCTLIGYFLSAVLPGRPGEVVRPVLLAARARLSRSFALATVVLERAVLDPLTLLALLALSLLASGPGGDLPARSARLRHSVESVGALMAALLILAVVLSAWLLARRRRLLGWLRSRLAAGPRREHWLMALERFADGLSVLGRRRLWPRAILGSLAIWGAVGLGMWGGARAFSADIGYLDALALSTMAAAGVAVPTPGGVGGFHLAVQIGLTTLYGVSAERSVPAALFTHLVMLLPALTVGAALTWKQGLDLSSLRGAQADWEPSREG